MKKFAAVVSAVLLMAAMSGSYAVAEENASPKPELSLPKVVLSEDDIKEKREVSVSLKINGANKKYSAFEFWTKFDDRLAMPVGKNGLPQISFGSGVSYMQTAVAANSYYDHSRKELVTVNGVRTIGASHKDLGFDGTIFTVTLTLPEDAKAGDVYPLDIIPITSKSANNDYVSSTFMNSACDEEGKQMQEWLFTNGLKGGYIKITSDGKDIAYGDVTGEGNVSAADVVAVLQYSVNSQKYGIEPQLLANGDVDGDGDVDVQDAFIIQQYDAKVIDTFPAELKSL